MGGLKLAKMSIVWICLANAFVAIQGQEDVTPSSAFPPLFSPVPNIRELCAATTCAQGTTCRVVFPCEECQPEARCLMLDQDIDAVCREQMYSETVLQENSTGGLQPRLCGLFFSPPCQDGSDCVDGGICCIGKQVVKPGLCPPSEEASICGEDLCNFDIDCPDEQKCCGGCGKMCTTPVEGCDGCDDGETCVQRPAECPPGVMFCEDTDLVPTCVPLACANCRSDQECRTLPNIEPCPQDIACPKFISFCGLKSFIACDLEKPCPTGESCQTVEFCESVEYEYDYDYGDSLSLDVNSTTDSPLSSTPITTTGSMVESSTTSILYDPFCGQIKECYPDEGTPTATPYITTPGSWGTTPGTLGTTPDLGCGDCFEGETCLLRPRDCPVGAICTADLVPTCVPNACVDCTSFQECRQVPNICPADSTYGDPCPEFRYFCGLKVQDECGEFLPCPSGSICNGTQTVCADGPTPSADFSLNSDSLFDPNCDEIRSCISEEPVDPCGGCPEDWHCVETNIQCKSAPCPPSIHTCVRDVFDPCHGCPPGEKCVDTGVRCVTEPCPSHKCVSEDVGTDPCNGCPAGQVCDTFVPPCPPPPPECTFPYEKIFGSAHPLCNQPKCDPIPVCVEAKAEEPKCDLDCPSDMKCELVAIPSTTQTQKTSTIAVCVPQPPQPPCTLQCPSGYEAKYAPVRCPPGLPCPDQCSCVPSGRCPVDPDPHSTNFYYCMVSTWYIPDDCAADSHCKEGQKCCMLQCNRKLCVDV